VILVDNNRIKLLLLLAERLEHLNVDSRWARQASGTRGAVLKALTSFEEGNPPSSEDLDRLIQKSFEILAKAAREIPDLEELRKKYLQLKR
jgi:hypothetical protein